MNSTSRVDFTKSRRAASVAMFLASLTLSAAAYGGGQIQVPTTNEDFKQPGTQPGIFPADPFGVDPFQISLSCTACHGSFEQPNDPPPPAYTDDEPYDAWVATMMAQATRDPVWQAAVAVANQDAAFAGEYCIRCHSPFAWLSGRSTTGQVSDLDTNLFAGDFDGVSCHFCHRLVNPVYVDTGDPAVDSPNQDEDILDPIMNPNYVPVNGLGQARYILDPEDRRRGPFDDFFPANPHISVPAETLLSPYHQTSELCGTCHDVSTPTYMKQRDGTYLLTGNDAEHPTQDPNDMFPEQRTYSEWLQSDFATTGVQLNGRFGGNHLTNPDFIADGTAGVMKTCQDCHMPDAYAAGSFFYLFDPAYNAREDMPKHTFAGSNTWVLGAIFDIDQAGDGTSGLTPEGVAQHDLNTIAMLQSASDMELTNEGDEVKVRIINYSGHKLPTGYPEGRRLWINVKFFDDASNLVAEIGHYDEVEAELDEAGTKIYKAVHDIDAAVATATGLSEGTENHLALSNRKAFDNRIPPIGFTNAGYASVGAAPVGATYADGQHWDDTFFPIPPCATRAEVTLNYQTTTREYIEFLRDSLMGSGNDAGDVAYQAWDDHGRMVPVAMDSMFIGSLVGTMDGDANGDGMTGIDDIIAIVLTFGACPPVGTPCPGDVNCDGNVDIDDIIVAVLNFD